MTHRVIRVRKEGGLWRAIFGPGDFYIFSTRASALASALGRACLDDGGDPETIAIEIHEDDEFERTAVSPGLGARLEWLS